MESENNKTLNITLRVGEGTFETSYDTLAKSRYFETWFRSENKTRESPPFTLKLDRDPEAFRHVLKLLRNPDSVFPAEYFNELEFYDIGVFEKILENPAFMQVNDSTVVNWMSIKYIRYDEDNNFYQLFLSSRKRSECKPVNVFPGSEFYEYLNFKRKTFNELPDFDTAKVDNFAGGYEFFLNWYQVKLIKYREDDNKFCIDFSTRRNSRRTFTISSENRVFEYLKSRFAVPDDQKITGSFVKVSNTDFINLNHISQVTFDAENNVFKIYLSCRQGNEHMSFEVKSNLSLHTYLKDILESPKILPIAKNSGDTNNNLIKFDDSTIINWSQISYAKLNNNKNQFNIYLSSNENVWPKTKIVSPNTIIYDYLLNKLSLTKMPNLESRIEPAFSKINDYMILNLEKIQWMTYNFQNRTYAYKLSDRSLRLSSEVNNAAFTKYVESKFDL